MAYHADTTSGAYGRGQAYQKYKRDAENTKAITNIANEAANLAKIGLQAYSAQQQENADIVSKGSEYENTVRQNQENGFIGSNPDIDGIEDAYNTSQGKINDDFLKQGLKETYGWSDKKISKYLASEEHQKLVDTYSGNRYQVAEGTTASVKAKTEIQGRMAIIDADPNMSFEDKMTAKNAILDEYGDGYSYDANGTLVTTRIDENYNYNLKPGDEGYIYRWDTDGSLSGETGRQQGVFSAFAGSAKTLIDDRISYGFIMTDKEIEEEVTGYWDSQASVYFGTDAVGQAASAVYKEQAMNYAKEYYNYVYKKEVANASSIYSRTALDLEMSGLDASASSIAKAGEKYGLNPVTNPIHRAAWQAATGGTGKGISDAGGYPLGGEVASFAERVGTDFGDDLTKVADAYAREKYGLSFDSLQESDKADIISELQTYYNGKTEENVYEKVNLAMDKVYNNPVEYAENVTGELKPIGYDLFGREVRDEGETEVTQTFLDKWNNKIRATDERTVNKVESEYADVINKLADELEITDPYERGLFEIAMHNRLNEEAFASNLMITPKNLADYLIQAHGLWADMDQMRIIAEQAARDYGFTESQTSELLKAIEDNELYKTQQTHMKMVKEAIERQINWLGLNDEDAQGFREFIYENSRDFPSLFMLDDRVPGAMDPSRAETAVINAYNVWAGKAVSKDFLQNIVRIASYDEGDIDEIQDIFKEGESSFSLYSEYLSGNALWDNHRMIEYASITYAGFLDGDVAELDIKEMTKNFAKAFYGVDNPTKHQENIIKANIAVGIMTQLQGKIPNTYFGSEYIERNTINLKNQGVATVYDDFIIYVPATQIGSIAEEPTMYVLKPYTETGLSMEYLKSGDYKGEALDPSYFKSVAFTPSRKIELIPDAEELPPGAVITKETAFFVTGYTYEPNPTGLGGTNKKIFNIQKKKYSDETYKPSEDENFLTALAIADGSFLLREEEKEEKKNGRNLQL